VPTVSTLIVDDEDNSGCEKPQIENKIASKNNVFLKHIFFSNNRKANMQRIFFDCRLNELFE
jgi:hypothetical protein